MRLLKPSWVSHAGNPIFSLDIHPDGSRLATGGQGEDSGRIVIWNMAPIINDEDEKDDNVPKMLCQLDNHLACVNCVRWSNNGKYLASGGDDKVLMIWHTNRYATGSTVFGSGGKVNIEQWRCVSTLRGHSGDILDLAWSPHDAWLASCSVDNTVVVWNANKFPEILSVLRGHSGLVKGVSWDPVGKYLASQSDDKSLFVWRTVDWQQEASITEPFEECGGTTHVLRLSWSPDGQYLVSAHAMNNSGPTAQIIERDGWKTEKDFVGHRKAITVAKFNPHILSKVCKDSSKVQHYCCCAIGSRDRSLSIWLTALKRPLVVVHDLFANSVLDISWSRRGHQLTVCSWDGTIAYVDFSEEEIGHPLSPEEESVVHQKMYGKSLAMNNRMDSVTAVIENPEMLKLKEQQKEKEMNEEQKVKQDMLRASVTAKGPINKQIETRTADGRRRITPMFIAPAPDLGDVPLPFNSKTQPTFSSSTESKSRIIIEKRNEMAAAAAAAAALTNKTNGTGEPQEKCKSTQSSPNKSAAASPAAAEPAAAPPVSVPNGISPSESSNKPLPNTAVSPASTTEPIKPVIPEKNDKALDKSKEVKVVKPPDTNIALKRKEMEEMVVKPAKRRPGRPPLAEKLAAAAAANASPKNVAPPPPVVDREPRETNRVVHGTLHLPALKADKGLSLQVPSPEGTLLLELENNIQASSSVTVQKLKCSRAGTLSWEVLLASKGVAVAGSSHAVAVVCEDNSLSVFSPLGQRAFPSIVLPSSISRLLCSNHFVMVLTTKAHIYVWDVKNQRIIVKNETLYPIMNGSPSDVTIVSCSLTDHGSPVISLSTGKAYVFNSCMACWMMVSNADDVLQHCSDHQQHMPTQTIFNGVTPPLATLQAQGKRPSQQVFRLFRSLPAMQQTGTLSYLDSQLAAALSLHSRKEYKFWLLTLTRYLVQEGVEVRLREVCNSLLGPIVKTKSSWDPYILGLHKHDLLEEILPVIGSNLRLQRLFTEYQEQLEMVKT